MAGEDDPSLALERKSPSIQHRQKHDAGVGKACSASDPPCPQSVKKKQAFKKTGTAGAIILPEIISVFLSYLRSGTNAPGEHCCMPQCQRNLVPHHPHKAGWQGRFYCIFYFVRILFR